MPRKKQYVLNIDYTPQQQERLRRFVGARGYKSVREFIRMAIENEIEADLQSLGADRAAFEKMISKTGETGENL